MDKIKVSDRIKLCRGKCEEVLKHIPDNSISSIVTDPPYGLTDDIDMMEVMKCWLNGTQYKHPKKGFMGKDWDSFVPGPEIWKECYRVLKPGGYLVSFGGTRTYDLLVLAIRIAGFEIRDKVEWFYDESEDVKNFFASLNPEQINTLGRIKDQSEFLGNLFWLYGQGFPKSLDVSKAIDDKLGLTRTEIIGKSNRHNSRSFGENVGDVDYGTYKGGIPNILASVSQQAKYWEGWGTALKPANEPICLARKPLEGTVAENFLKWGTGGINIDGSRIDLKGDSIKTIQGQSKNQQSGNMYKGKDQRDKKIFENTQGRFPANIILDETAAKVLDEQSEHKMHPAGKARKAKRESDPKGMFTLSGDGQRYGDFGGASRFFYLAKASTSERNKGLENRESQKVNDGRDTPIDNPFQRGESLRKNTHPTVKPISLIKYLIKLVTPKGGVCLDLYNGSGTAGCAIVQLNEEGNDFSYFGIDREQEYIEISKDRIEYYLKAEESKNKKQKEETKSSDNIEDYFE